MRTAFRPATSSGLGPHIVRTLVLPEPVVEFLARCSREVRGHVPWPRMWREPVRRRGARCSG